MANPTTTRVSNSTYMTSQTQTHTMLLCIVGRQRKNYFRKKSLIVREIYFVSFAFQERAEKEEEEEEVGK